MTDIININKRGEWYTIKGAVDGKVVSADVHASNIEGRPKEYTDRIWRHALEATADAERNS